MNEATIRGEVRRALNATGRWCPPIRDAMICPKCNGKVLPAADRPDVVAMSSTLPDVVVEIKATDEEDSSFPFRSITTGQRKWLTVWVLSGNTAYLALGTRRGRVGSKNGRRLWLVPWPEWIEVENRVRQHQISLPIYQHKCRTNAMKEEGIYADAILDGWELEWAGGAIKWRLPPSLGIQDPANIKLVNGLFAGSAQVLKALDDDFTKGWGGFYEYWRNNYE